MGALEIVTYQEDALANHYFMVLPAFPGVVDMQQTNFRILNVDIPEKVIDTYEVTHGGKKATRPSGVIGTANEFSFSYRADKYMKVYRGFMAWMEYIQSSQTGTGMGDAVPLVGGPSPIRVPITIQTAEADKVPNGNLWQFNGCFPTSHGAVTFDENSGDPIEVSVTMACLDIVYPQGE